MALIAISCKQQIKTIENSSMQEILASVADTAFYIPQNVYANHARVKHFEILYKNASPYEKHNLLFKLALEKLNAGLTEEAITHLEYLNEKLKKRIFIPGLDNYAIEYTDDFLALAYLRLGEQENCLINHNSSSCIIPIEGEGVHTITYGSRTAIEHLKPILESNPSDLTNRWLLNIAYMTLDEYPSNVPEKYLISIGDPQNTSINPFTEIAAKANLAVNGLAGGCVIDDFNNDFFYDLIISEWHPKGQLRYFVFNQDQGYVEYTNEAGLMDITGGTNIIQGDYNNDGFLDIFITRGGWLYEYGRHPNSLLRNNGDNTFTDVTKESGLLSFHPSQTAVFADFNNDGWLDIFVGNESTKNDIHPCELYINNQNGRFIEKSNQAGISISSANNDYYVKGVTAGDYNNDGWQDIYISTFNEDKSNILMKNLGLNENGDLQFKNVTKGAGVYEDISSFPTWFWDFNNDGWLDIFVAGYLRSTPFGSISGDIAAEYLNRSHDAETAKLYLNQKNGKFIDISKEASINKILYAMGANYGDIDNDGWLDMYMSTGEVNLNSIIPNRMFRNIDGSKFREVTINSKLGHIQKGHAISFADIDNDGDQDIYAVMGGAYEGDIYRNALFENNSNNINNWISLKLQGNESNRSAIGSKIKIVTKNSSMIVSREVNSGGSFGASPLRAEIGLGDSEKIDTLTVKWSGTNLTQVFTGLNVNKLYVINEGNNNPKEIKLPKIIFSNNGIPICISNSKASIK